MLLRISEIKRGVWGGITKMGNSVAHFSNSIAFPRNVLQLPNHSGKINRAAAIAPLVVVPGNDLYQTTTDHLGAQRIDA